jgi:phage terminase Nu1 subunit (DNA packaging protein)
MSDAADTPAGVVNKTDLSTILRTSIPTLDKLLRKHGDAFPVVRRGGNGVAYAFDPAAVIAFLRGLDEARIAAGQVRDDLMQQYTLPEVVAPEEAPLSPRDRLQLAKLGQIEREEKIRAGFLVETATIRASLFTAFTALRRDMTAAVRQELRNAGTPEAVIRSIEARIGEAQRTCIANIQEVLKNTTDATDGDQPALL